MFSSLRPLALAAALLPSLAFAQFSLPPLPYAADALEPVIDKVFDFDALPDAFAYLESGRAKGKVVVRIAD